MRTMRSPRGAAALSAAALAMVTVSQYPAQAKDGNEAAREAAKREAERAREAAKKAAERQREANEHNESDDDDDDDGPATTLPPVTTVVPPTTVTPPTTVAPPTTTATTTTKPPVVTTTTKAPVATTTTKAPVVTTTTKAPVVTTTTKAPVVTTTTVKPAPTLRASQTFISTKIGSPIKMDTTINNDATTAAAVTVTITLSTSGSLPHFLEAKGSVGTWTCSAYFDVPVSPVNYTCTGTVPAQGSGVITVSSGSMIGSAAGQTAGTQVIAGVVVNPGGIASGAIAQYA